MFKAEFTHEGDKCSFEVLLERIGLKDAALRSIAEIARHHLRWKVRSERLPASRACVQASARQKDIRAIERACAGLHDTYSI